MNDFTFSLRAAVSPPVQIGNPIPEKELVEYAEDGTVVSYLASYEPSISELLCVWCFKFLNGGRLKWTENTSTVATIRAMGPGWRGAEQLLDLLVVLTGLFVDPIMLFEVELTRNDALGDFLVGTSTLGVWILSAVLLFLARSVGRESTHPVGQARSLPEVLVNDAWPRVAPGGPDTAFLVRASTLVLYNALVFVTTVLSIHTLLIHTYVFVSARFGWLLLLRTSYAVLAAVDDTASVGGPYGFPRLWPRRLMAMRAVLIVALVVPFTITTVSFSDSWW